MTIEELDRQVQALADWYIAEHRNLGLAMTRRCHALAEEAKATNLNERLVAAVLQGFMLRVEKGVAEIEKEISGG